MAPYSMDLRTRVLRDWDAGMKADDVAAKYSVSRAWVHRLYDATPRLANTRGVQRDDSRSAACAGHRGESQIGLEGTGTRCCFAVRGASLSASAACRGHWHGERKAALLVELEQTLTRAASLVRELRE
jgi:L-aminopeptidase/D-esterase-like protein